MGIFDIFKPKVVEKKNNSSKYEFAGNTKYDTNGKIIEYNYPSMKPWLFSASYGVPRRVNVESLRDLANTHWVSSIVQAIIKEVRASKSDIVSINGSEVNVNDEDYLKCLSFKTNPSSNGLTFNDINELMLKDYYDIGDIFTVKIFGKKSYEEVSVKLPKKNYKFDELKTEVEPILLRKSYSYFDIVKPKTVNESELLELRPVDAAEMVANPDEFGNFNPDVPAFFQYNWNHAGDGPKPFFNREVIWKKNIKSNSELYGWSPVMSLLMVLQTLVNGTRDNKLRFENNSLPDVIIELLGASKPETDEFMNYFRNNLKGNPHKAVATSVESKVHTLTMSNRDLEWLEGQKFYYWLVMACFGITKEELGMTETSNRSVGNVMSNVVFVRRVIKPAFEVLESIWNEVFLEITKMPKYILRFTYEDENQKLLKRQNDKMDLEDGVLTVNEVRAERGKEPVVWGDKPLKLQSSPSFLPTFNNQDFKDNSKQGSIGKNLVPYFIKSFNPNSKKVNRDYLKSLDNEQLNYVFENSSGELKELSKKLIDERAVSLESKDFEKYKVNDSFSLEKDINNIFDSFNSKAEDVIKGDSVSSDAVMALAGFILSMGLYQENKIKSSVDSIVSQGVENAEDLTQSNIYLKNFNGLVDNFSKEIVTGYTLSDGTYWAGIKGVCEGLSLEVEKIVNEGIKKGTGNARIKELVQEKLNTTKAHAQAIARTESNRILNKAQLESVKLIDKGNYKKQWLSKLDSRTSDICKRMNGQTVGLNEVFKDSVTGETFDSPPAHCLCRSCTITIVSGE
ncbi:MAG: phage portal protein [Candidatus Nanoarchaeia archaeon]|jgi:SPP1 gp7 family putative phage head morphogenesis protein